MIVSDTLAALTVIPDQERSDSKVKEVTDAFTFMVNSIATDRKITIDYDYENLKDNVTPEEAADYFARLKQLNDNEAYSLTYNGNDKNDDTQSSYTVTKTGGSNPLYSSLPIILFIAGVLWWTQRKQQS